MFELIGFLVVCIFFPVVLKIALPYFFRFYRWVKGIWTENLGAVEKSFQEEKNKGL